MLATTPRQATAPTVRDWPRSPRSTSGRPRLGIRIIAAQIARRDAAPSRIEAREVVFAHR